MAGEALLGRAGGVCFTWIVIISVTGSLAAVLMAFPRVYYAMARDGLFFAGAALVDARWGTPARSIAIQAVLASVLALSGTFNQILDYFMVPTIAFVALTVGAVFVLRRPAVGRPALATPGFPVSPLLFLVPIVALILMSILRDPLRSLIGFFILLLGVPVSNRVLLTAPGPENDNQRSSEFLTFFARTDFPIELFKFKEVSPMAWIRTIPLDDADESLLKAMADQRRSILPNMHSRFRNSIRGCPGSLPRTRLFLKASSRVRYLRCADVSGFASRRRQHEMIATMVSLTNKCHY